LRGRCDVFSGHDRSGNRRIDFHRWRGKQPAGSQSHRDRKHPGDTLRQRLRSRDGGRRQHERGQNRDADDSRKRSSRLFQRIDERRLRGIE
jgi:hypothetical protein